jgi:5-methyltetrahydropteroyltriglutamate--homocysteine methyltransferase
LLATGRELRARHWEQQKAAGIDLLPVGDFAWYDHVLTTSLMLGNVPARHQNSDGSVDIDTLPYWPWPRTDRRTRGSGRNDQMV